MTQPAETATRRSARAVAGHVTTMMRAAARRRRAEAAMTAGRSARAGRQPSAVSRGRER
jgi:hypothetical protein